MNNLLFFVSGPSSTLLRRLTSVKSEEQVVPESEAKALKKRIRQLEQVLGQKTLENEILREAVNLGREKKLISRQPLQGISDFE